MRKYDNYKQSGFEWLGEIPEHWRTVRVKDAFTQVSISGKNIGQDNYIPLENIESHTGQLIQRVSNENNETTNLFKAGDILLNKLRPYLAKVYLPNFDGGVSGEAIVFRVANIKKKKVLNRYFFYRFLSSRFIEKINSITDGVKMPRANPTKINCLDIEMPPLPEQTAIATYLDHQTQTIDKKTVLLTQKIAYYKELRKALINRAVTKGITDNVEMKDSGVEWIGEIPRHWEVRRVKAIANTVKGKSVELSENPFTNSLHYLSLEYLRNESIAMPSYCFTNDKVQICNEKDLIIIWDGAGVGEILNGKKGILSPTTAKFVFRKECYFGFFFHLRNHIEYVLKQIPTGMGIPHLNPYVLNNFLCPFPPLSEQIAIATYLDQKTNTIDSIVSNIEKQIATLKALRKTLINEAVTGKVKVSEL